MTRDLIVDDEETIRHLLGRQLEMNEYACTLACDAAEARKFMGDQNFELLLCDVNMPGESGMDFIQYVLAEYPDTAVVMVTAVDDREIAETALKIGVYGYVTKPFKPNEVMINVDSALRRRKLEIDNRAYRQNLEQMVVRRTTKLRETLERLQKTIKGIIHAMALTVESRDPYTAGHQLRVARLAFAIAKEMGLSEDQAEGVRVAGSIHDLGKISVPGEILSKPAQITALEFEIIKTHSQVGCDILKEIDFPWPLSQIVLQHHEKMDGSGYPQGLSGEEILVESRILCVADVVEAMTSHRPHRPTLGIDKALDEIQQNRGTLYDTVVVDACLKLFKEKEFNLG